jgi:hypothetical protein
MPRKKTRSSAWPLSSFHSDLTLKVTLPPFGSLPTVSTISTAAVRFSQ